MFKNKNMMNQNRLSNQMPFPQLSQAYMQIEEINRKLKNLNNRLRRVENYLGLRNDDKFDNDVFLDD